MWSFTPPICLSFDFCRLSVAFGTCLLFIHESFGCVSSLTWLFNHKTKIPVFAVYAHVLFS